MDRGRGWSTSGLEGLWAWPSMAYAGGFGESCCAVDIDETVHGREMISLVSHRPNPRAIALLIAALTFGIDQVSKQWALDRLRLAGSRIVLPGPVDLTLVFNYSNAFGLAPVSGDLTRWGLATLNLAVAAALSWVVVRRSLSPSTAAGLAFLVAGATGNAFDRIRLGAVIDFIDASKLGFVWVFNIADASVDVGIGLLLLAALMARRAQVSAS